MDNEFPFPSTSEHTTIVGRNGSGKTQGGVWLLSHMPFDEMPYVIVDHKGDDLIAATGAKLLPVTGDPPTEPGLYRVAPRPRTDDELLEKFLWKIHERGRTGLFFDEGYVVAKSDALDTILMQGRSKEIPCITLAQRPTWLSRYAFSESSHFIAYHLHDRRDQKTIKEFFNNYQEQRLADFHAQWYDVKKNRNFILHPVPSADNILDRFKERLDAMKVKHRRFI